MGCRITKKTKSCDYTPQGISKIWLLDYDDFTSLKFKDDGLYNNNLVNKIYHTNHFVELEASEGSQFTTSRENGLYTHTLNAFVEDLVYSDLADFDLASKSRKYLVKFLTNTGKYFLFGYKPGATFSYTSQTQESIGSLIQLSVSTIYPLFEVRIETIVDTTHSVTYVPSEMDAFCEELNGSNTGVLQYRYMLKISATNGEPLDVDNQLCSMSKKQQVVLALQGSSPIEGYEIQGYYDKRATIGGVPTFVFNPAICVLKSKTNITIEKTVFKDITLQNSGNNVHINPVDYRPEVPIINKVNVSGQDYGSGIRSWWDSKGLKITRTKENGEKEIINLTFALPATYGNSFLQRDPTWFNWANGDGGWEKRSVYAKENGWFWFPMENEMKSVYSIFNNDYGMLASENGDPKKAYSLAYAFGVLAAGRYDGTQTKDILFDVLVENGFRTFGGLHVKSPFEQYAEYAIFIPTRFVTFNIVPSDRTVASVPSTFSITKRVTEHAGAYILSTDITKMDFYGGHPIQNTNNSELVLQNCNYYLNLGLSYNQKLVEDLENKVCTL